MRITLLVVLASALLASCSYRPKTEPQQNPQQWKVENGDSVLYEYNAKGQPIYSYTLTNRVKNGICKNYYPDGKVKVSTEYTMGVKNGVSLYYYEDGTLYRETPYIDNQIHGVRKVYHKNGQLAAEIPYDSDFVIPGTREWKEDGSEVKHEYQILVSEKDNTAFTNEVILTIRLNKKGKSVKFYTTEYDDYDKDYFDDVDEVSKGVGKVVYTVSKGDFIMKKVRIMAEITTKMGNKLMLEKVYNLSVENR